MKRALALLIAFVMLAVSVPFTGAAQPAYGDLDGSGGVTAADARLALRAAVGLDRLTPEQALSADADHSGSISAADARLILRCAVGLEEIAYIGADQMVTSLVRREDRGPWESTAYELEYLASVTAGEAEHAILDEYVTFHLPVSEGMTEEDLVNVVGVTFNDAGEPFFILPDAQARAQGRFEFVIGHFSIFGAARLSDERLLDLWAERAAAQSETRRISEEELTPGLAQMLEDCGLAKDQYGGAIARAVLSLDTRGEILTAAVDGDGQTLRAKLVNYAGEYVLGKLLKEEEDQFLTQSLGDNADNVKKAIKEGRYKEALTEIVKNVEKNMFPYVNYADKIASLTDKLADIWTDDMMNEQYEVYKKLGGVKISDDDWNLVYMQLRGAATRLSAKGVSAEALRAKFEQRAKNEDKIAATQKVLLKDAAGWRRQGLMDTHYWYDSYGNYPSDTERLNSLLQTREMLRDLLTLNGKFQRGKGYLTDKDFLEDALATWVINGVKGREEFFKWLREKGVYLQGEDTSPADNAWVLVDTYVDVRENTNTGIYKDTFTATEGRHSHTVAYIGDEEKTQHASFTGTCDAPPAVINKGDRVVLNLTLHLTDSNDKDYHFGESASVRRDIPGMGIGTAYSGFASFKATKEGEPDVCSVNAIGDWGKPPVRITSATVCHTFGGPGDEYAEKTEDGSYRICIYFCSCGAQTVWVYEWRELK